MKRGNTTVAMPTGPEQLRMRLTVMANTLIIMRMKHTARNELKDITPAFFEVQGLPPWRLCLRTASALGLGAKLRARYQKALLQDNGATGTSFQTSARKVLEGCYSQREAPHHALSPLCQARIHGYGYNYAGPGQQGQQGQRQGQGQGQERAC